MVQHEKHSRRRQRQILFSGAEPEECDDFGGEERGDGMLVGQLPGPVRVCQRILTQTATNTAAQHYSWLVDDNGTNPRSTARRFLCFDAGLTRSIDLSDGYRYRQWRCGGPMSAGLTFCIPSPTSASEPPVPMFG